MKEKIFIAVLALFSMITAKGQNDYYYEDFSGNNSWHQYFKAGQTTKIKRVNSRLLVELKGSSTATELNIENSLTKIAPVEGGSDVTFNDNFRIQPLFTSANDSIVVEYLNAENKLVELRILKGDSTIYSIHRNGRGELQYRFEGALALDGDNNLERAMACGVSGGPGGPPGLGISWEGRRCTYGVGFGDLGGVFAYGLGARWTLGRKNATFPIDQTISDIGIAKYRIVSNCDYYVLSLELENNKIVTNPKFFMRLDSNYVFKGSTQISTITSKPNSFTNIVDVVVTLEGGGVTSSSVLNDSTLIFQIDTTKLRGVYDVTATFGEMIGGTPHYFTITFEDGITIFEGPERIKLESFKVDSTFNDYNMFQINSSGGVGQLTFNSVGGALPDGISMSNSGLVSGTLLPSANDGMYVSYFYISDELDQYHSDIIYCIVENATLKSMFLGSAATSESKIIIYPNPTNNLINIENVELSSVQIYDYQGRLLISTESNQIDISNLPVGTYIVKITNLDGTRFIERIVKN